MAGTDRPDVDAVVARLQAVYRRWRRSTPVAQMRADWEALFTAEVDARITPVLADGVPCEWITAPGARDDCAVLYLHGGGFRLGSLRSHRDLMARISAAAGMAVLGVGYRLSPEHAHPAPLQDAQRAYGWLAQRLPARHLAVAGDSAGGGLALSLLLSLVAAGDAVPAACWGLSAWTDLTASGDSYDTRAALDPIHQRPMIQAIALAYLGPDGDPRDPLVSPLFATAKALRALPPLLLQVGERETVASDSEAFVQRAYAAGAQAELDMAPGMIHVFQQFAAELPEARAAIERGGRFLRHHLAHRTPSPHTEPPDPQESLR